MHFKTIFILSFLIFINAISFSQKVEFIKRDTLHKVISYYEKTGNSQKIEAAKFLFENIDLHKSVHCNWYDQNGIDLKFDELTHTDFTAAEQKLQELKDAGASYRLKTVSDTTVITADYLIENIDLSFKAWKTNAWSKTYDFETFKQYILPYRNSTEPLQNWRDDYKWFYDDVRLKHSKTKEPIVVMQDILKANKYFEFQAKRNDPMPLLGPMHIFFRKKGACPDITNLNVYAAKSLGIATAFDFTPHWAASSNRHMWNCMIDADGKNYPFDDNQFRFGVTKRIGKVFRITYAKQENSLAGFTDPKEIPSGFLKYQTVLDVTDKYVPVSALSYQFKATDSKAAYICVFNTGNWMVTDWSKVNDKGLAVFKNLGNNLVYLPALTDNYNRLVFENYPVLISKKGETKILKPALHDTFNCELSRDNETFNTYKETNSTKINDGINYQLVYWDGIWKTHEIKEAKYSKLSFQNVPKNALFLLKSKDFNGFERIFTINPKTSKITWY